MTKNRWSDQTVPPSIRTRMQAVKQKNTAPEIKVRKLAHSLGLRFRLHVKALPGNPDLVFPKWKTCVFVHGCFWHRHSGCRKNSTPIANVDLWNEKFRRNVERDLRIRQELEALGWRVEVIWECETKKELLTEKLDSIFGLAGYSKKN